MNCQRIELTRRQLSRIRTIAADFILYYSDGIRAGYESDDFFSRLSAELDDSVKYFKEKFPDLPSWIFWEIFFDKLNQEFAKLS